MTPNVMESNLNVGDIHSSKDSFCSHVDRNGLKCWFDVTTHQHRRRHYICSRCHGRKLGPIYDYEGTDSLDYDERCWLLSIGENPVRHGVSHFFIDDAAIWTAVVILVLVLIIFSVIG